MSARTKMAPEEAAFYRGIACALSVIAIEHDQPTMAADVLKSLGVTRRDFRAAAVDEEDMAALREALAERERLDRLARASAPSPRRKRT